jgi:hypothetical protein
MFPARTPVNPSGALAFFDFLSLREKRVAE